ncbi:MAG TPA: pyrroline-5-carboxylate reductase [Micavibrio sp.]|jgi:pyrroline-5-carboxylate reductase
MKIALIGCGKMGSAMLRGWLAADMADEIHVIKPSALTAEFASHRKVKHFSSLENYKAQGLMPDVVVLAVKPQIMDEICADLKGGIQPDQLIISVATGKTIDSFEKRFGTQQPIIRAMPNTPMAVGKGMTVGAANKAVNTAQAGYAEKIFQSCGVFEWAPEESINTIAALSGSGPAYLALFAETLAQVGQHLGLSGSLALLLARQTLLGTGAWVENNPQVPLADLRSQVTSPGGSTAKAVEAFQANSRLERVVHTAVTAAIKRNVELSL